MGDQRALKRELRTFGQQFVDQQFTEAVAVLSPTARTATVESFPGALVNGQPDAAGVLEQYWWGLHGQFGPVAAVEDVTVHDATSASITFACANGDRTATVALADGAITDVTFPSSYSLPPYADAAAYTERAVTVDTEDVVLDGVLTVPEDSESVPGVLLVHGAGVHDPDGTVDNSKILKDFAVGLATRGIATLRYEKRLAVTDVPDDASTLDRIVTDDALAALDRLATAASVGERALFVAGHSQGGMAAPRIAARHDGVAGVVNLDGAPTSTFPPAHADVIRYEYAIDGALDDEQTAQLNDDRETFERIVAGEFDDDEQLVGRPGVWHRSLLAYDPVTTAENLSVPVLSMLTSCADEETQPELAAFFEDRYATWREATLPDGSRVEQYRNVDHYFQPANPPLAPLSLYFGDNVLESVISDVAEWITNEGSQ